MVFYIMARYDDAVCYDKVRWCFVFWQITEVRWCFMLWQGTIVLFNIQCTKVGEP